MKDKRPNQWHAMETDEVISALRSDMSRGLSPKDAASRRSKCGENAIWRVHRVSAVQTALGEFADLAAILLVVTALLAAVFRRGGEAAVLIVILAASALIRTAIYIIAHRIFENAARENIPHASVIRKGVLRSLAADAVVPGDILLFSPGDPVTADVRLLSGEVSVSEAGVTENRGIQRKSAAYVLGESVLCEERTNMLFAGSTVVGGSGRGIAVASGERTYVFAKRGPITVSAGEELPVLAPLSLWCRNVSLVMIAAVLLITLGGLFFGRSSLSADALFLSALSMAVASMSEFLCVIASIVLAVPVQNLRADSGGGTVVRSPDSIEKFGRARCIVLSDPRLLQSGNIRLHCAFADGSFLQGTEAAKHPQVLEIAAWSLICRCGSLRPVASSGDLLSSDAETEMLRYIYDSFSETDRASLRLPSAAVSDHTGRLHTVLVPSDAGPMAYVSGSLADVLACCSDQAVKDGTVPIETGDRRALLEQAHAFSRQSVVTCAVACRTSPYTNLMRPSALHNKMTFLGFCAIVNPVEVDLVQLVQKCRAGGIRIAVMAAHPESARILAAEAGIVDAEADVLSTDGQIEAFAAAGNSSFGACIRVTDTESRENVLRLITDRIPETVYVGDRLQDVPLFGHASASAAAENPFRKAPQCLFSSADASLSAAEGKRTSGAAETVRVISACRNALLRLRGAAEYLLSVQALRLTLMLAAAFFGIPMLTPVQLLLWGLILDFLAVLNYAFARPSGDVLTRAVGDTELPSFRRGLLFPLSSGVLVGLLLCLAAALAERIDGVYSTAPLVIVGGVFASLVYLLTGVTGFRFRSVRINAAALIYAAAMIAVIVGFAWGADYRILLFSLVPACIVPLLHTVYDRVRSGDETVERDR